MFNNIEFSHPPSPDPDHARLTDAEGAQHEIAGVLRMFQAGMAPPQICKELGMSKQQLIHELNLAIDDVAEAERLGQKVVGSDIAQYKVQAMMLVGWK